MTNKILIFILFVLNWIVFTSCKPYSTATSYNNDISSEVRQEINIKSKKIIKAIVDKDYNTLKELSSKEFNDTFDPNNQLLSQAAIVLKDRDYKLLDIYHTKVASFDRTPIVIFPDPNNRNSLKIDNLIFNSKEKVNVFYRTTFDGLQVLVFLSFGRYDNKWQSDIIHFANYSFKGKNAVDYYDIAFKQYGNNEIMSSAINLMIMNNFIKPAPFLFYKEQKQYQEFSQKIFSEVNEKYKFPIKFKNGELFSVNISNTSQEIFPAFLYLSNKRIGEENMLIENESSKLAGEILSLCPDLKNNFDVIHMKAYNEYPNDPQKQYNVYGTFIKTDNLTMVQ